MLYQIKSGDTLLSIASAQTLSPAYASALMALPENDGQAASITDDLTGRGVIYIPDSWAKASYSAAQLAQLMGGGTTAPGMWILLAAALALVALS